MCEISMSFIHNLKGMNNEVFATIWKTTIFVYLKMQGLQDFGANVWRVLYSPPFFFLQKCIGTFN
jgi:hypothetical protein